MKILITGATGFIGKNFLKYIKENCLYPDEDIILLSSQDMFPYKCINHKQYSFDKEDFYKNSISNIDIVIHMGAFTPKSGKDANAISESISNINNTLHLINNLPSVPEKIIFLSTIDVYKNTDAIIDESTSTQPNSLYGLSKLFCEKIVELSAKRIGFIPQILRIGHIYGIGEEKYQKLIPETIKKVINNETPVIFSNGLERRSFLSITDCCRAIFNAIKLDEYVGPINIVSNKPIAVKDIVQMIINMSGKNISCKIQNKNILVRNLTFSNKKMETYLCSEKENFHDSLLKEYKYFNKNILFKQKNQRN